MITQETASAIWSAYREIEAARENTLRQMKNKPVTLIETRVNASPLNLVRIIVVGILILSGSWLAGEISSAENPGAMLKMTESAILVLLIAAFAMVIYWTFLDNNKSITK